MVDLRDATRLGVWAVILYDENNAEKPLGTALTPQIPPIGLIISQTNLIRRVSPDGRAIKMASTPTYWEVTKCQAQWAMEAQLMNTAAIYMKKVNT